MQRMPILSDSDMSLFELKTRYVRNYLTFAEKNSKDFLLYISGHGVYDSPEVDTQICDVTMAPQYIRFPQDTALLNEARMKLEAIIDSICSTYALPKPRTYRKVAHKASKTGTFSEKSDLLSRHYIFLK